MLSVDLRTRTNDVAAATAMTTRKSRDNRYLSLTGTLHDVSIIYRFRQVKALPAGLKKGPRTFGAPIGQRKVVT
jgi:hypothetical protein